VVALGAAGSYLLLLLLSLLPGLLHQLPLSLGRRAGPLEVLLLPLPFWQQYWQQYW
jgi:hypothetical protein